MGKVNFTEKFTQNYCKLIPMPEFPCTASESIRPLIHSTLDKQEESIQLELITDFREN